MASAVTSCGTLASTALNPITSPGPAIFRIIVLPSRDVEEIFTCPKQMTKTLRAGSPSENSLAPRAWLIMMPIWS